MVALAWRLWVEGSGSRAKQFANQLFGFSILYLFVLFAVLLVEGVLSGLLGHAVV
jgi:protoheme IX farnesyltransferase